MATTWRSRQSTTCGRNGFGLVSLLLLIWLIIGVIAAGQRGYYKSSNETCAKASTIAVTIVSGPLNYFGVNPKITCHVPQPSK